MNKILDKFKSGVYVVTTSLDGKDYGLTVSWCTKVSKEPDLIAISIGKNRKEYDKIKKSEMFAVNILGEEHLEIGRHFGISTGENVNNFEDIEIGKNVEVVFRKIMEHGAKGVIQYGYKFRLC